MTAMVYATLHTPTTISFCNATQAGKKCTDYWRAVCARQVPRVGKVRNEQRGRVRPPRLSALTAGEVSKLGEVLAL